MRAPPESLRPITGAPTFIAWSMILQIFSAWASQSEPPNTVKSWLKAKTRRPLTVPWPVTTPSPGIFCFVHAEIVAAVLDEHVPFLEGAGIEQQLQPLARGELALGVLLLDALLAAALARRFALFLQPPQYLAHDASPRASELSHQRQIRASPAYPARWS